MKKNKVKKRNPKHSKKENDSDDNTAINKLIKKFKEDFSIIEEKFENKI